MERFTRENRNFCLNRTREVFLRSKDRAIHHMLFQGRLNPLSSELEFFGVFRPIRDHADVIIMTKDGLVLGYSRRIAEILGLDPHFKPNINEICPDFFPFLALFNRHAEDQINKIKERMTKRNIIIDNSGTKSFLKKSKT